MFPVFHPAAALYAPANKKVLEEDFAKLRILLERGSEPASASRDATSADERTPLGDQIAVKERAAQDPPPERTEQLHLW